MAKKNLPGDEPGPNLGGRPPHYRPEYCEALIKHMSEGNSFQSFGAVVSTHRTTLYDWAKEYPEFMEAKRRGLEMSLRFYENMGKMIATGNLRRVVKEEPMIGPDGQVVYDRDGKVLYRREYAPAVPNAAAWIFLMKNMHAWRDKRDITLAGDPDAPLTVKTQQLSPAEKLKEVMEMHKVMRELEDAGTTYAVAAGKD